MDCPKCKMPIPSATRYCPACQTDVGFPNVRAAQNPDEQHALNERHADAIISAKARGIEDILKNFGFAVLSSKAVIARNLSVIYSIISSENILYTTFYKQIRSNSRIPEENKWDLGRTAIDTTLFPYYCEEIHFAALSLDGRGLSSYGAYTMVLKEEFIEDRTTVFEENPFNFCETHRIVAGNSIPPGFRALWAERGKLAESKLHSKLDASTSPDDYPGIILNDNGAAGKSDFIEAHIYGPIHRRGIERVIGPKPKKRADLVLWKSLKKALDDADITLEEI